MTGLVVVLAVLVAATGWGLLRRRRDGVLRPVHDDRALRPLPGGVPAPGWDALPGGSRSPGGGVAPAADQAPGGEPPEAAAPGDRVSAAELTALGGRPGASATLLQFSSAFCQPCRATRRVLAEVAGTVEGVRHVEVDAEAHLELVNRLRVRRTPTVLVLDQGGRVARRGVGQPRKADVIAAVGALLQARPAGPEPADSPPRPPLTSRDEPA